jgi:hypothetical protein
MNPLTLALAGMMAVMVNARTNDLIWIGSSSNLQILTNYPVMATNRLFCPTNWCDRIPANDHEQAVRDLAAGGMICKVLGHSWRDGRPGEGNGFMFADLHPGTTFRTCKICGWCESKTEESWR